MARPPSDTGARPGAGTGSGTGALLGAGGAATAGPGPPAPNGIVSCPHQRSTAVCIMLQRVGEGGGAGARDRERNTGVATNTNHCCVEPGCRCNFTETQLLTTSRSWLKWWVELTGLPLALVV
jgi:hypothetical protein